MQDLTTGSVTRHLLKTTSFMLVTMVFQTLYFLVDLYWVGRLGKEAVAAVGVAGNLMFIVLAVTPDARRRHDDAGLARRRAARITSARCCVFNQSLVLSAAGGRGVPASSRMALRAAYARGAERRRREPPSGSPTSTCAWFIPAMALQFAMVAMGAALRGTGNFKPGMVVQTATVILNMVLAPFLIFGWVTHRPLGVAGAAIATLHRDRRRHGVAGDLLPAADVVSAVRARGLEAAVRAVGAHAQDRAAGRRRVRADGGVPVRRLRRDAGRSAPRRRPASASACASSRRASCRWWRSASRWRRSPARTSARGTPERVRETFRSAVDARPRR